MIPGFNSLLLSHIDGLKLTVYNCLFCISLIFGVCSLLIISLYKHVCIIFCRSLFYRTPLSATVLSFILVILDLRRYRPILYPRYPLSSSLSSYPLSSLSFYSSLSSYPLSLSFIFVAIVLSFILVIFDLRRYRPILYPRYPSSSCQGSVNDVINLLLTPGCH